VSEKSVILMKSDDEMRTALLDILHGPEEELDNALARYRGASQALADTRSPEAAAILSENVALAKSVLDACTVEGKEEIGVTRGAITKRSEVERRIEEIADEIAKVNPNLTPQEAFSKALSSEEGRALRARYNELPVEERAPVSKGPWIEMAEAAESRETHPAVAKLQAKADEIHKDANAVGVPISEAEAFARAKRENPELIATYYQERH
jgi:hypothetical protein